MAAPAAIATRAPVFVRYLGASGIALCLDLAVFAGGVALGLPAGAAAAVGYSTGIALHWWLSSRAVFAGVATPGAARARQQMLFVLTALVGLALTTGIVTALAAAGVPAGAARAGAVGASFVATYLLRRAFVFG